MIDSPVQARNVVVMVTAGSTPGTLGGARERHELVDGLLVMENEVVLLDVSLQQHDGLVLGSAGGVHATEVAIVVNDIRVLH